MKFTFGIITDGKSDNNLIKVIDSIERQNIPEYQIIIVGNTRISKKNIFYIPFDESVNPKWITRKKNLITLNAKYNNIVYTHDYITFEPGWYDGYVKYGNNFKICMNIFNNPDGSRFRDWLIWPHNGNFMDDIVLPSRECLIPYHMKHLSKFQYISGAYWVAKKNVMLEFPLNENLFWGQSEDVIWSKKVRKKYNFSMNPYSIVKSLKFKHPTFYISSESTNKKLMEVK